MAGDARDQRRLALTAPLVGRAKPIPALRRVRVAGLCGIDHEAGLFFGDQVHARPGGEIVRRLGAAVQHDDQRERLPLIAAGDVELVGAGSGRVAVGRFDELPARRHDVRRGHWSGLPQALQSEPRAPLDTVEQGAQRAEPVRLGGCGRDEERAIRFVGGLGLGVDD